jgi:multidrug transporter EmrE-like cation transporter
VAAFLISIFALNESAAPARIIAVVLIVAGIVLLERT